MRVKVKEAAQLLETTVYTIQCGMQTGQLPIGVAQRSSSVYTYLIYSGRLADFIGVEEATIINEVLKLRSEQNNKAKVS